MIFLALMLLFGISHFFMVLTEYVPDSYMFSAGYVESMFMSDVLQIILAVYGLFAAFLLTIQTKPNLSVSSSTPVKTNNVKYDMYCSECGNGLFVNAKFCSKCGAKVQVLMPEPETSSNDDENKFCKNCGEKLDEGAEFCSECGTKVTDLKE